VRLFRLNEDTAHGKVDKDFLRNFLQEYKGHEVKLGITANNLTGGAGDGISIAKALELFDFDQIHRGVEVELEHTDNILLALEIAIDHLMEHERYYDYLDEMESQFESVNYSGGYPGSSTGGTRTSPNKEWPDEEDLEDDTPEKLEKSNIYQPILKEPNDHLKPKHPYKGPGD
jgi:hypothetical protein